MIRPKINLLFTCCLIFFISISMVSPSLADDPIVKVFKMNYRIAEEMEEAVKLLLSPDGGFAVDKRTNSLIVKDYPENIRKVEEFLNVQDTKIEQVRIKVRYINESTLKNLGLSINWYYRDNHWSLGNFIGAKKGFNIDALIGAERKKQQISGEQTLMIMSGSNGRIAVGRSIPYTDWFYLYSWNHGYLVKETRFIDVSTGFVVRPRVLGNNINITIAPQINYLAKEGTGEIIYHEASTTVACKDGETLLIGSSSKGNENIVWNILGGAHAAKGGEDFYIFLTPEIVK